MKTILITGGSRGIGAATALLAAQQGYQVAINYLKNKAAAEQVVRSIQDFGGKAMAFQGDVSVVSEVEALFRSVDQAYGPLHVLVNNAGILETQSRVQDMDIDRIHRVFNSNFMSCFMCCKEAIKRMSTLHGGSGGSIVNVSSTAARTGSPGEYVDYAASKGAVDTFTIGLSKEVAEVGIRVNAVRPGFIHTDIHASGGEPGRIDRIKSSIPLKRGGKPEEVAQAILWLASDLSPYTTGAFIDITGGR